jgi:hypothetical protein
MSKRAALVPALLLVGLVAAIVGATAALRFIGTDAFGPGGKPLSQADVRQALAQQSPAAPPATGASPTPTPRHPRGSGGPSSKASSAPAPVAGTFAGSGGSVIATCLAGHVRLRTWMPAVGYGVDGYYAGPAFSAWVKFKGTTEQTVTATCVGDRPHFTTAADDHNGGGGDDDNGGGGGRGGGSGRGGSGH